MTDINILNRKSMKTEHFKFIGQKSANGKMILIAVVPEDLFGIDLPNIFEVHAMRTVPNIYTGTYPTIRIMDDTFKSREDLKGLGVNGIVTGQNWYNASAEDKNEYGINID